MVRLRKIFAGLAAIAASALLGGCAQELEQGMQLQTAQKTFKAQIKDDSDTRVCVDATGRLKWHEKDTIAVLAPSAKALYSFDGPTGSNIGTFSYLEGGSVSNSAVVAVYPYDAVTSTGSSAEVDVNYPAVQKYEEGTFDRHAAIMAAVTSGAVDDNLNFYSANAFVIVKVYGSDYIRSISLKGNAGELLSGPASIKAVSGASPAVTMSAAAQKEVSLDCGGIPTGATAEEASEYWIAIPPTNFQQGFTVTLTNGAGQQMEKSTDRAVDLTAGKVQPMAALELSLSGGKSFTSFSLSPEGSSNSYRSYNARDGYLTIYAPWGTEKALVADFEVPEGTKVTVNGTEQQSGVTVNDFTKPVYYTLETNGNGSESYVVEVVPVELPVMFVNTPGAAPILNKVDWIYNTEIFIQNLDGTITAYAEPGDENLGNAIRGRGNSTWGFAKKPYAIKLAKKADMLNIMTDKGKKKGHKRWCLLANWRDRTLVRNDVALKIAEHLTALEWSPSGKFVELVLNGSFDNTYYLCEQIKVDENRLNIDEMKEGKVGGLKGTGGYLLEFDTYTDETIYRTAIRNLPVKFKSPDPEDWTDKTEYKSLTTYMMNWLNDVEKILSGADTTRSYTDYVDVDSFIDYWILNELVQNIEPANGPRSCYMYKKRDPSETETGKLYAGPVWDYDCETFHKSKATSSDKNKNWDRIHLWYLKAADKTSLNYYRDHSQTTVALYYGYLFNDPEFCKRVVKRWNEVYPSLLTVSDYIQTLFPTIFRSAERNAARWPSNQTRNGDETLSVEAADALLLQVYNERLDWMNKSINSPDFCVAK